MTEPQRKVLFIVPSLHGGGAQRVMLTLLRHLDRSRFAPHLALIETVGPFLQEVPEDVPLYDLNASRVRYALPAIIRLVGKLRPDAVLSTLGELNLAMLVVKPLLPQGLRLLVREAILVSAHLAEAGRNSRVLRYLYRRYYARADKIICVADYVLNDLAEQFGVPREKMVTIYNSVDFARIRRFADSGENPYSGPGPHIVAAGRLSRQKGFDRLLEAMTLVRKTLPLAELTILGAGPLESELKAQRERLGLTEVVHFAGFRSNPYPYFKHADVFVLSSRYEGMPNVVLEAMALGTPVVATDCPGGVKEIVARWPTGRLVPASNASLLAEEITSAASCGKKVSPESAALQQIVNKFGVERMVREYEDLLSL